MVGRLYSVWIDSMPGDYFTVYLSDGDARAAFRRLLTAIREDIAAGILDAGTDTSMDLYYHGTVSKDGVIRGASTPKFVCTAADVLTVVSSEGVSVFE